MKTIAELRCVLDFYPEEINSQLKHFSRLNIDFNVYLPSLKMKLQRDFVWSLHQKKRNNMEYSNA